MKRKIIVISLILFLCGCSCTISMANQKMIDLTNMSLDKVNRYVKDNKLKLNIKREYNDTIASDKIISQSIVKGTNLKSGDTLTIIVSDGPIPITVYQENKVNELGNVPIMMYHSITNMKNGENKYTGGNVDKDGYDRTSESFNNDLEMYYKSGYRMIRLIDYINGDIDVPLGKSPIILTFDDGNKNNINVTGLDDKGNIIIDPNSAVGILESFKKKYPDFDVTATFFVNSELFGQSKYNDKILKWLIDNGYDIGNHTKDHVDFTKVDTNKTQMEVSYIYKLLDGIIPNKYEHIVALPYGSPGKKTNPNFQYILKGNYEGYAYETLGTLRVGWDAEYSPFNKNFDKTFMKRIRAWDNNGQDFDIEMVFKELDKNRYISDGNKDTIVTHNDTNLNLEIKNKKIIKY